MSLNGAQITSPAIEITASNLTLFSNNFLIDSLIYFLQMLTPFSHQNCLHLGAKITENLIQALLWTPKNPKGAKGSQKGTKSEPKVDQSAKRVRIRKGSKKGPLARKSFEVILDGSLVRKRIQKSIRKLVSKKLGKH